GLQSSAVRAGTARAKRGGDRRYGVLSVCTSAMLASRFGPWQIRHSSFCGLVSAVERGSPIEAPFVCMWSTAHGVSLHCAQASAIVYVTSVGPCALHGGVRLQVATTPVHGAAVVQVHVAPPLHVVVVVPIFWVKVTATLLTVYGPLMSTLHGLVA